MTPLGGLARFRVTRHGAADRRRRAAAAVVCAAAVLAPACREVGLALGPTPAEARAAADELIGTLARRFGPHDLDPGLRDFRPKVSRASLSPSQLFDERGAWLESEADARCATYAGAPAPGSRYRMALRPGAPPPARPGDYRGRLCLRKLGAGEYEWSMREALSVGRLRAGDAARALTEVLRAVEAAPSERGAEALRAALPHTAAALGRAFSIHGLHLRKDPGGGTVVLLEARLRTDSLAAAGFGAYAGWLTRHVSRMRFRITARGADGAPFWEVNVHDGRLLLSFRSLRGNIAPLAGAPRPVPDALALRVDFSVPGGPFRVGLEGLEADLRLVRAEREKSVEAVFRRQPGWRLPFILRPFLRASLRRPFEGDGARLAYALRETPEGPTLLAREYRLAVRESWIVRWLGGLGSRAADAFRRDAEEESDRFSFEVLDALRRDALALIGG